MNEFRLKGSWKMLKKPMEADMLCTIDGEIFHLFTKNT